MLPGRTYTPEDILLILRRRVWWLLVPFAALIAASRVVLGLHYPSDVAAGALIGATLAVLSMVLVPLVG